MKRKRRPDSFRVSRRTRGFLRGRSSPLKRLQQRRNRYPLFFAKLFFLPGTTHGHSGGCRGDCQSP